MTYQPQPLPTDQAGAAAQEGELVPWREAARLLGINPRTLARWIDRGKLPFVTIGRGRYSTRYVPIGQASELEAATRHRRDK